MLRATGVALVAAVTVVPQAVASTVYVSEVGQARLWPIDAASGATLPPIQVGGAPGEVIASPDGKIIYVANATGDSVTPVDVATNAPKPVISVGVSAGGLAVSPDGATSSVTLPGKRQPLGVNVPEPLVDGATVQLLLDQGYTDHNVRKTQTDYMTLSGVRYTTETEALVGETVPATLSPLLRTAAVFGAFTPGAKREHTANMASSPVTRHSASQSPAT